MTKLQLDKGRIIQKLKTREVLISKANELLKKGNLNSIEQAAKEAGISKATAYRYFTKLDALKREASLQLKSEKPEGLFKDLPDDNVALRLERLINYHFNLFIENESEFRLFLSSVIGESLIDNQTQLRGGRRIALIAEALAPLNNTVSKPEFDHMVYALSLVFGIESITILRDLCKLDNHGILENWQWTVARIVGRHQ
ncbi:TetR/AcrR family transcriptional regulator [Mucilaginibacter sp. FT3.2]|uniref:TetR/AcrR family transcriptional regulator n=1 Tax=Mucilaginibacter sp. FT3.2 TaxID=2723090 RepID=UPI00162007CF|nr:TetR/AcrR family transcriptional regulator [Mucilaginibacter sp. FT3.2]MBB6229759.1 AcrR family transcriptional regulator [Mucilaginibacter sp. FT3.2]